jgi:Family of unknown function (DUF5683)
MLCGVWLLLAACFAFGQEPKPVTDTSDSAAILKKPLLFQPNPKKAGLYSAILPGLGQVYNRQIWKVPFIYAGLAVAGYFIVDNLNNYQLYRKAYVGRINNPNPTDQFKDLYTESQLQQLQDDYGKLLNETIFYTVIGFGGQVIDAIVSAHLRNFDVSRDISLKMVPSVTPNTVGMALVLKF